MDCSAVNFYTLSTNIYLINGISYFMLSEDITNFEKNEKKQQILFGGGSSYNNSSSHASRIVTTVLHIVLRLIALFIVCVCCFAAFGRTSTSLRSWHPSLSAIGVSFNWPKFRIKSSNISISINSVTVIPHDARGHFRLFGKFISEPKFKIQRTHGSSWRTPTSRLHILCHRSH